MKVIKEVELNICDFCKENETGNYNECRGCGKLVCYDCRKIHFVEYSCGVWISGGGDGLYCHDCDKKLVDDPIHVAYVAIDTLIQETRSWQRDFKNRSLLAEEHLEELQKR